MWALTGGIVGWLVARGERQASIGRFVILGAIGATGAGLLGLPLFSEVETKPGINPFFLPAFVDFVSFNAYAATCGSAIVLWVRELVVGPAR